MTFRLHLYLQLSWVLSPLAHNADTGLSSLCNCKSQFLVSLLVLLLWRTECRPPLNNLRIHSSPGFPPYVLTLSISGNTSQNNQVCAHPCLRLAFQGLPSQDRMFAYVPLWAINTQAHSQLRDSLKGFLFRSILRPRTLAWMLTCNGQMLRDIPTSLAGLNFPPSKNDILVYPPGCSAYGKFAKNAC